MSKRTMDDLKDMLCKELDEIAMKGQIAAGDLQTIHMLTDTIKNIDKIGMLDEGYSGDGGEWDARGSYGRGDSYGRHYVRGHYSRSDARDMLTSSMNDYMRDSSLSNGERETLNRAMQIMRNR